MMTPQTVLFKAGMIVFGAVAITIPICAIVIVLHFVAKYW